mmetsp:Transcript_54534/g.155257  ORF Transcript_54534/g.155257 Transcript_54534/m.155257 type:complete len:619 (+) Transcript_54534:420-2276(+)
MDHDGEARAEHLALVHGVAREHEGVAAAAHAAKHVPEEAPGAHVDARGRLVEEHHVGLSDERKRRGELPLVAATELLGQALLVRLQAHLLDHAVNRGPLLLGPNASDARIEVQRLPRREQIGQRVELRAVAQMAPRPVAAGLDAAARERNVAPTYLRVARDHAQGRGLAGAVDAQEPEALARLHPDADPADRVHGLCTPAAAAAPAGDHEGLAQVGDQQAVLRGGLSQQLRHALGLLGHGRVLLGGLWRLALEDHVAKLAREAAPLDEQAHQKPDTRHDGEAEEKVAGNVPLKRTSCAGGVTEEAPDADVKLLGGPTDVVVRGDVHQSAAQAVVGKKPRQHGLEEVVERSERWHLNLVQVQRCSGQHRDSARKDVDADQRDVGRGRHGEERLPAVHEGCHAKAVQQKQQQDCRSVCSAVGSKLEREEQYETDHHGEQEVDHVPGIGRGPVEHRRHARQQLLVLGVGGLLMHTVHDEAGGDETHGQDDCDCHEEVGEDLARTAHPRRQQCVRHGQRMAPRLRVDVVVAEELQAGVVAHVYHGWDGVVCTALEPEVNACLVAGSSHRHRSIRTREELLAVVQEVLRHAGVDTSIHHDVIGTHGLLEALHHLLAHGVAPQV